MSKGSFWHKFKMVRLAAAPFQLMLFDAVGVVAALRMTVPFDVSAILIKIGEMDVENHLLFKNNLKNKIIIILPNLFYLLPEGRHH
jgi:fumarate reductase subunit D